MLTSHRHFLLAFPNCYCLVLFQYKSSIKKDVGCSYSQSKGHGFQKKFLGLCSQTPSFRATPVTAFSSNSSSHHDHPVGKMSVNIRYPVSPREGPEFCKGNVMKGDYGNGSESWIVNLSMS